MLQGAPASIGVDRAQPLTVVTYWQHFGAQMWLALALAIVVASIGYVGMLRAASTGSAALRYLSVTMVLSALACGAALLFPVVFSSDVYAYAGYGDMVLHGINPYAHARIAVHDPLLDAMVWQWGNPPPLCVYGPAFVWLAKAIVATFLPLGAAAPLWALRILACLSLILCAPLAYAAFAPFSRSVRLAAAAGIALNPGAIGSAAEGHNDSLALAIVLGGFALASRAAPFWGALIVALSALVKAPGLAAAVALGAASFSDRSKFARIASGAALGIAFVLALALPLEHGVRTQLLPAGHYFPQFSLQYVSVPLTIVVIGALLWAACMPSTSSGSLRYLRMTPVALAALLAVPNPYPWYAIWLLPVAFLAWESAAAWSLIFLSLLMALRYYPDATSAHLSRPLGVAIVALEFGVPLLLMAAHIWSARQGRREIRMPVPDFAPHHSA